MGSHRPLTDREIAILQGHGNMAQDWSRLRVAAPFLPEQIQRCRFFGDVTIGAMAQDVVHVEGLQLPQGLYDSVIADSEVGSNATIHRVGYLSRMQLGDNVVLFCVGEMLSEPGTTFGEGFVAEGNNPSDRLLIALGNENSGRSIAPFANMRPADAWLWCKYRDRPELSGRFMAMTDTAETLSSNSFGVVGAGAVIRHSRVLRNVRIGAGATVVGVDRLENITVLSDDDEPAHMADSVTLRDGIMGYGCEVHRGVTAEKFILGTRCTLEDGARFINSCLGDNSTIAGAEVQNALIFPGHEQHHSNSFLIAAVVAGQSNIAAGVTAGSNHNSRAADGELLARRGFWPALCVSLRHNSCFASFTLLAKGAYPHELDIRLPFSLVSSDEVNDQLQIIPAYWFLYNRYALARNSWKFAARDRRVHRAQPIEYQALAPDTVEEILDGLRLLEVWTGQAAARTEGKTDDPSERSPQDLGRRLLQEEPQRIGKLDILAAKQENSHRPVRILKAAAAWQAYRQAVHHYAIETLVAWMQQKQFDSLAALRADLPEREREDWCNLGGQIARQADVNILLDQIESGRVNSWEAVHREMDRLQQQYPQDKAAHALVCLLNLHGIVAESLDESTWRNWLEQAGEIARNNVEQAVQSRQKDFDNPFRQMLYDNPAEMEAVLGRPNENPFIQELQQQTDIFCQNLRRLTGLKIPH